MKKESPAIGSDTMTSKMSSNGAKILNNKAETMTPKTPSPSFVKSELVQDGSNMNSRIGQTSFRKGEPSTVNTSNKTRHIRETSIKAPTHSSIFLYLKNHKTYSHFTEKIRCTPHLILFLTMIDQPCQEAISEFRNVG